ncbi:malto-oligosyltrehalose trehalohydrolase [Silvibacterium acidisoli]|uniref:malto-oligosyltrehalose trehalohydrolase n=1 Tax=Acidobacteriaceae bacterium ZG23-2 TaxID=2883246 RepID=UPI00406C63EC
MHTFRVWAPNARKVQVKVGEKLHPLTAQPHGWWQAAVETAKPGSDYVYRIDDDTLDLPDPRSAFQPEGVHGPSRVVDHAAYPWKDASWKAPSFEDAIVYELHIGTFTPEGTYRAAQQHIGDLKDLGITHVELTPVSAFPGVQGWGYDGVDLYAPHAPYGSPDELKAFVDACHAAGLAVLLDVVYNHLGPSGNYTGKFGPYFTASHHTPWGDAVNFEEGGSDEVRRFFIDNALMWLRDYHFDGLRLDAVHAYVDRSAIHFMEQLATDVRALEKQTGHTYAVIAESDLNDPRVVAPIDRGGYGFDAQWSDDFQHAIFSLLANDRSGYYADFGSFADLAKALERAFVYDGQYSAYRDHAHGRPIVDLPSWKFLGYSQNHDQVGNRAQGERISHLVSEGRTRIAAAVVLTAPFVPMLFQGEEWAASTPFQYFTDHDDPDLGRAVSEGRKKEFVAFGWKPSEVPDPQSPKTFEDSKLKWEERSQPQHAAMLDWYRRLIHLRKTTKDLAPGPLEATKVRFEEKEKWMMIERGSIRIVFSLAEEPVTVDLGSNTKILLQSSDGIALSGHTLKLTPDSVAILRV